MFLAFIPVNVLMISENQEKSDREVTGEKGTPRSVR